MKSDSRFENAVDGSLVLTGRDSVINEPTGWLILCDRDGCHWRVHVAQSESPTVTQAAAVVAALGGVASTTSDGKLRSHCALHAERQP